MSEVIKIRKTWGIALTKGKNLVVQVPTVISEFISLQKTALRNNCCCIRKEKQHYLLPFDSNVV